MKQVPRVSPEETREKVISGTALLVCAYADDEKFKRNHLEGAISLVELDARRTSLSKDHEIIFYCA
jgi:hypothetical protein